MDLVVIILSLGTCLCLLYTLHFLTASTSLLARYRPPSWLIIMILDLCLMTGFMALIFDFKYYVEWPVRDSQHFIDMLLFFSTLALFLPAIYLTTSPTTTPIPSTAALDQHDSTTCHVIQLVDISVHTPKHIPRHESPSRNLINGLFDLHTHPLPTPPLLSLATIPHLTHLLFRILTLVILLRWTLLFTQMLRLTHVCWSDQRTYDPPAHQPECNGLAGQCFIGVDVQLGLVLLGYVSMLVRLPGLYLLGALESKPTVNPTVSSSGC